MMKILIDTHILLWSIYEPEKLSSRHKEALEDLSNTIYVSSISLVEIIIKNSIGKLEVDFDFSEVIKETGFELLDFSADDATSMKALPLHHKDPFDRMLIAQAISRNFHLMSEDSKFSTYSCKLLS